MVVLVDRKVDLGSIPAIAGSEGGFQFFAIEDAVAVQIITGKKLGRVSPAGKGARFGGRRWRGWRGRRGRGKGATWASTLAVTAAPAGSVIAAAFAFWTVAEPFTTFARKGFQLGEREEAIAVGVVAFEEAGRARTFAASR